MNLLLALFAAVVIVANLLNARRLDRKHHDGGYW